VSIKLNRETVSTIYEVLFDGKQFEGYEYVEVDYDKGDGNYTFAFYVQDLEMLLSMLETANGEANFAIHYTTKRFKNGAPIRKRSSKRDAYRCRCIIVDFEPKKKSLLSMEQFNSLYTTVDNYMLRYPEIRKAIAIVSYTGGGGQLYIRLSRWIEEGEIHLILDYLRGILRECPIIDVSTFNVAQGQRLIGTYSVKWKTDTYIVHDFRDTVEPLDVDMVLKALEIEEEVEIRRTGDIEKAGSLIRNLKDVIEEIKRRVKFADLGFSGHYYGTYSKLSCPFHPPDNNPSFVVYHRTKDGRDIDLGYDTHEEGDEKYYDVISFYQKLYNKSFIEAVKDLAKKAGIKLTFDREQTYKARIEAKLRDFDFDAYIREELGIRQIMMYKTEQGVNFEFVLEDIYGETKKVEAHISQIRSFKKAELFFLSFTYHIPEKLEPEVWTEVLRYIITKADRPENELEYDRQVYYYELEYIEQVIYNAEGTDNIQDFLANKATKYFAEDGRVYLNVSKLLLKISGSSIIARRNLGHITSLLRKLGAVPVRLSGKLVWLLPANKEWRYVLTEQDVERIEKAIVDNDTQMTLIEDEKPVDMSSNSEDTNTEDSDDVADMLDF